MLRFVSCSFALLAGIVAQAPAAAFRSAGLFGDHMVLPAATAAPLWGRGVPGAAVQIEASWGAVAAAQVAADGRWRTTLTTPKRGDGPFTVTLRSGSEQLVWRDVVVGDVWLASGQSNMEMQLGKHGSSPGVRDHGRELAAAELPQLRFFTVAHDAAEQPVDDVVGQWVVSSPATAGRCSAVAWLFAADLVRAGHGPIGLVVSSWGGTVAEAWVRDTGLAEFPEFAARLQQQRNGGDASREARVQQFWRAVDACEPRGDAIVVALPDHWSSSGLGDFDGVAIYRRRVELPPTMRGRAAWLELPAIDDMDGVTCNGVCIGGHRDDGHWHEARRYRIDAVLTDAPHVELMVRVVDTGGEGGPAGDGAARWTTDDGAVISLADGWQRFRGPTLRELPPWPRGAEPNRPAVLWNGMIAPLLPFPFRGVLWYQGESNRARPDQYARLFPALITDWRAAMQRDLPFFFVQIAPFGYRDDRDHGGDLTARLREAQAAALALPHTGMVVTLDCGCADDIHPIDKQPVGKRLAALARRQCYGEAIVCRGPEPVELRADGAALRVRCRDTEGGLQLRDGGAGFELAGADGRFVAARAEIDGDDIVLRADGIGEPRHVRYAWSPVPPATLWNGAGLPAAPFRRSLR